MYLLYVDNEFISTADIKEMVEKSPEDTDIINCFSTSTLLKTAERLNPEIIIIDFELVKDRLSELFSDLREKSEQSYVMALINPDNYEKLYRAIEAGAVDDYIVKPIRKEEFLARVRIAAKKNKREGHSTESPGSGVLGGGTLLDFDRHKSKPQDEPPEPEDQFIESDDTFDNELEDDYVETTFHKVTEDEPPVEKDLEEDAIQTGETEEEPPLEEHEFTVKDLLDEENETEESYDFDDIMPEESTDQDFEDELETDLAPEVDKGSEEEDDFELFDDFSKPDDQEEVETDEDIKSEEEKPGELEFEFEQEDTDQLFEEGQEEKEDLSEMFSEDDFIETVDPGSEKVESDTEAKDLDDFFTDDEQGEPGVDSWDTPLEEDTAPEAGPSDAAPFKPSADFLDDVTLKAPESDEPALKEEPSLDTGFDDDLSFEDDEVFSETGPVESTSTEEDITSDEDDRFFDELFEEKDSPQPDQSTPLDEPEATPGEPSGRKSLREISELPGETADDFLFGDSSEADEDFDKKKLDELIDEGTFGTSKKKEKIDDQGKGKKRKSGFPKFLSILGNVFFVLLLLIMATLSFFLIQSRIAGGVPEVAGYQMYIVLSGSMSPEFDTGSLAFVQEVDTEELAVGDIITYRSSADAESLTTHRIVEIIKNDSTQFVTRGDANNVNDPVPVLDENVVGKVTGSVPYVGYVLNFVQTRQGLILLIFVPGVLIIVYELGKIMKYLTQGNNKKDKKENEDSSDTRLAEH